MSFISKFAFATLISFCGLVCSSNATVTLSFSSEDLMDNTGTTMPVNGLLELVADTAGNGFAAPTADAFVSGDDVILASFALNGNLNGAGTTQNLLIYNPSDFPGLAPGDSLIFRWFPTLTASSTAPGAGTMYGQFNTTTNQDGSNLPTPWTAPSDGQTLTLNFITMSEGGSNADSYGYANLIVVPEPSTPLILGMAMLTLLILKRRIYPSTGDTHRDS